MKEVIPFNYGAYEIRVIRDENGEPFWIAKDVCNVLDIVDTSQAVDRLDDDEKLLRTLYVSDQNREVWLVNEAGLYTLIIRSNKPEAKQFKRWITHEVLPSIRKTGSYLVPSKITFAHLHSEAKNAKNLTETFGFQGNQALLSANRALKQVYNIDCLELLGTVHLISDDNEIHVTPTEIGKAIGCSPVKVNNILEQMGFQTGHRDTKKRLKWTPTDWRNHRV